jgi:enterochelin esterase-like enzyme
MGRLLIFFVCSFLLANSSFGQNNLLYSTDSLVIASENLNETICLRVHLPETFAAAGDSVRYPVTIIFDSQHERTYPLLINAFDLLTSETQIPETIIIGVPFTPQNRYYFTSMETHEKDTLAGIERMERFLFSELLPLLREQYKTNDFISFIGHSRTAFLVNYLAVQQTAHVDIAIALSGFFDDPPLSLDTFQSFLTDGENFPHLFRYYYAAGNTLEEQPYLKGCRALDAFLSEKALPANVKVYFSETANANHMTNFWVTVPGILMDAYSPYNTILDTWFHQKLVWDDPENPVAVFEADLSHAGQLIGLKMNPGLTHIFSLSSYYGTAMENYHAAIDFVNLGLRYFPDYLDLYIELIEYYRLLNDDEKVETYKALLREKVLAGKAKSEEEKNALLKYLLEIQKD